MWFRMQNLFDRTCCFFFFFFFLNVSCAPVRTLVVLGSQVQEKTFAIYFTKNSLPTFPRQFSQPVPTRQRSIFDDPLRIKHAFYEACILTRWLYCEVSWCERAVRCLFDDKAFNRVRSQVLTRQFHGRGWKKKNILAPTADVIDAMDGTKCPGLCAAIRRKSRSFRASQVNGGGSWSYLARLRDPSCVRTRHSREVHG